VCGASAGAAMTRILGIDPGKDGAAVLLDGRTVLAAVRTSELIGPAKWQAAHAQVTAWLRSAHAEHRIGLAVLELYGGRAGEGRGSMLTIGVGWGLWLGALSALEIPVQTPASASWTRDLFRGVAGDGKERGVLVASGMVPDLDLTPGRVRKPHTGLADAACLALWGASTALGRAA
jgi:hypothetical protein